MEEMCKNRMNEDYEDQLMEMARLAGQNWVMEEYNRKLEQY